MLSVDVNVLVYAFDASSTRHDLARSLLLAHLSSSEPMLIFPTVATGFLRVITDRRILNEPASPDHALTFLDVVLHTPSVRLQAVEADAWSMARAIVTRYGLRGPEVTDGILAACAITNGVTWYSFNRGFARFQDLRWINPADTQ